MALSIGIKGTWVKKLGPCLPCGTCKMEVCGPRYNLEMTTGEVVTKTEIILCQKCYDKQKIDVNLS